MPLYDYRCTSCQMEFEAFNKIDARLEQCCIKCNAPVEIQLSVWHNDWFHPFISEDFTGEPILVRSKNHYKELCRKHGVYAKVFGKGHNISEV